MPTRDKPHRLALAPWLMLILALGLGLTYVLQDRARASAWRALQGEFDFRANEVVANIKLRLTRYEQVLEGGVGLFAASSSVSRGEFAEYVRALQLEGKYPGIQGVGFSRQVAPLERGRHVAAIRAEGFPEYEIRPPGVRDSYTAIIYLEPFNWRNQRAFGYDMYSEPTRRAAMARARDEERTTISGKVRLLQETDQNVQPGFLMYLPVYRQGSAHQTVEERRAGLEGWVYAPFRMGDLMQGILGLRYGDIDAALDLEVYDGEQIAPDALMFDSHGSGSASPPTFQAITPIPLFGHHWTVVIRSLPAFDARLRSDEANLIAVAGTAGTLLLTVILWLLLTTRSRAVALAEDMTAQLRRSEARQTSLNRALRLLSDCNMALVHADDEYKLLAEICRLIVEHGGYRMAWVGYAEEDAARTVRPMAQCGYEHGYLDDIHISWADTEHGRGPTGTAIRTGATTVNQDVLSNPAMIPWRAAAILRGYQSSIALPLIGNSKVLGALMIYAAEAEAFGEEEIRLLEELAGDLAYGIVTLRTRADHEVAKEKVAFLAHFDPLTQLPNRVLLRDRFEHAALIAREAGTGVAMLYLDLDNFKQINDSLGHAVGDQVLVLVVARLRQCITPTDTLARLSGDEFIVLLSSLKDPAEIAGVADKIQAVFAEPITLDGISLNTTFSVGISLFPNDGSDFETLLKHADTAVGNAKEGGRNTYRFFTRSMNSDALERIRLTGRLHEAVRNQEFILHYQPQVSIASRGILGMEALVRWRHPVDGLIPPDRFIPLAEQSGHIIAIGEWVLNEACRQARIWLDQDQTPRVMAVNLSALQFKRGDVLEMVAAALARSGLPPRCLELELTESILLQYTDGTLRTLRGLKALGVKLSIDDFGTGYSSLSYLKQLAVDKLKIDRSFVRDMLSDPDGASIVRAIIQLGHSLQLQVIAEGVETRQQLAFLGQLGCDEVQGYLFSRPIPPEEIAILLAAPRLEMA